MVDVGGKNLQICMQRFFHPSPIDILEAGGWFNTSVSTKCKNNYLLQLDETILNIITQMCPL